MARVLLVGKGAPEHGGIPSFIDMVMCSRLSSEHRLAFANLTRATPPQGGRATVANLLRSVKDGRVVWDAARGCDVVHLHTALAPGVTALRAGLLGAVARARGARLLVHVHGGRVPLWARTSVHRWVLRVALAPAHVIVSVSEAVAETLRLVPGRRRVVVLDNGVDADTFAPAGAPPASGRVGPRVLYVGLLTPRKGVLDLMEASEKLRADGVDHDLLLVGGTPDEGSDAEAEVRDRLTAAVRLGGAVEHDRMPAIYRDADVFCLPSWYEAMPLSVLEAMASGLPVVATEVGDVSRVVVDGATGLLVPPRRPDLLAAALSRLLLDPDLRARMGTAGRAVVTARFSGGAVVDRLAGLYDELSGGPAR